MRWFTISQAVSIVAAGVILPFYIVFIQQVTNSYTVFAFIYSIFTVAGALTHFSIGRLSKFWSARQILVIGNILSGVLLLFVPAVTNLWQLYIVQVLLGIGMSLQKSGEKIAISSLTTESNRSKKIGNYHGLLALATAATLLLSGWIIDTFSIIFVFYLSGIAIIISGFLSLKIKRELA